MSEEEKKAIEITKIIIEFAGDSYIPKENRNALQTLLNLIDKQQKEIIQRDMLLDMYKNNYISKDKIREKIKEIENEHTGSTRNVLSVLQELLEA